MKFPLEIKNQEELDELIKDRISRERSKWERETSISEYRTRAEEAEGKAYERILKRDARDVLRAMKVPNNRHERILRLVDLPASPGKDGEPDRDAISKAFKNLYSEMPEVFGEGASVETKAPESGGEKGGGADDSPLTRERIENMSPEEINSAWDRVKVFLAGER